MSDQRTRIAVVLACFNRRETTLRCLRSLFAQEVEDAALSVHLLDDASPDGTAAAIRAEFPQVTVLDGNGQLFWGGGMRAAMRSAITTEFDFMLWLNDDVHLRPGALQELLSAHRQAKVEHGHGPHVIVGAVTDPNSGALTYSGFRRRNRWHPSQLDKVPPAPNQLTACDTMNGNCVLIPSAVVRRVGLVDQAFVHQIGDADYGLRAARAGAKLWIARQPVGTCALNARAPRWRGPGVPLGERLRLLNQPHGLPFRPWLTFMWRYGGPLGVGLMGWSYLKVLAGQ